MPASPLEVVLIFEQIDNIILAISLIRVQGML